MRIRVFLGALLCAATGIGAAEAQTEAAQAAAEPRAPTVTIINKQPEAPASTAVPELTVQAAEPSAAPAPGAAAPGSTVPDPAGSQPAGVTSASPEPAAVGAADGQDTAKSQDAAAAPDEPAPLPEPTLAIDIDLSNQQMTVSEHGVAIHTWPISSARFGYRTPTGTFRPTWMSKMWYSRQYDYAPMPHAVFFHKGVAIHATYAIGMLGRPASHGCVRLAPKNAAKLFKMVNAHGKAHTEIVVHGTPVHRSPRVAGSGEGVPMGRAGRNRYLPPSYAQRGYAAQPGYYYGGRAGRNYAAPRRPPRGLYSGYQYGYGF